MARGPPSAQNYYSTLVPGVWALTTPNPSTYFTGELRAIYESVDPGSRTSAALQLYSFFSCRPSTPMPEGTSEQAWLLQFYDAGTASLPPPPPEPDTRDALVVGGSSAAAVSTLLRRARRSLAEAAVPLGGRRRERPGRALSQSAPRPGVDVQDGSAPGPGVDVQDGSAPGPGMDMQEGSAPGQGAKAPQQFLRQGALEPTPDGYELLGCTKARGYRSTVLALLANGDACVLGGGRAYAAAAGSAAGIVCGGGAPAAAFNCMILENVRSEFLDAAVADLFGAALGVPSRIVDAADADEDSPDAEAPAQVSAPGGCALESDWEEAGARGARPILSPKKALTTLVVQMHYDTIL
eukprot:359846-Chlamydomonas_euryale.AAC.4